MKRYLYNYQTTVSFSQPIRNHAILLRCQPVSGGHQTVEEEHLVAPPAFRLRRGTDGFGNRLAYGIQREAHTALAYVSCGLVSVGEYAIRDTVDNTYIYNVSSRLAGPLGEGFAPLTAVEACHKAHSLLAYTPGATLVSTPAAEALRLGKGVCQDYAHVMIALCRMNGLAARYVCGLLEGEGETHAWVEVYDGYAWRGYDPTHDRLIESGYLKLAHGRDASDCPVSRGTYVGQATQQTQINATLKEI